MLPGADSKMQYIIVPMIVRPFVIRGIFFFFESMLFQCELNIYSADRSQIWREYRLGPRNSAYQFYKFEYKCHSPVLVELRYHQTAVNSRKTCFISVPVRNQATVLVWLNPSLLLK